MPPVVMAEHCLLWRHRFHVSVLFVISLEALLHPRYILLAFALPQQLPPCSKCSDLTSHGEASIDGSSWFEVWLIICIIFNIGFLACSRIFPVIFSNRSWSCKTICSQTYCSNTLIKTVGCQSHFFGQPHCTYYSWNSKKTSGHREQQNIHRCHR